VRSEACACGVVLRWPDQPRTWPRLMQAHNTSEQHLAWRLRTAHERPHIYEEHIASLLAVRPLVARSRRSEPVVKMRRVA